MPVRPAAAVWFGRESAPLTDLEVETAPAADARPDTGPDGCSLGAGRVTLARLGWRHHAAWVRPYGVALRTGGRFQTTSWHPLRHHGQYGRGRPAKSGQVETSIGPQP